MGKYLTTSYKIFQGSFKPDQKAIAAATQYFVNMLKKSTPIFPILQFLIKVKKLLKLNFQYENYMVIIF